MNKAELDRLKVLRQRYNDVLSVCDPVTYAVRQQNLLYKIAEYLIEPLQEHEMAERSKLNEDEDEN